MADLPPPILHTRYIGYYCDNCQTVWPFRPKHGNCPSCRNVEVRTAEVTVDIINKGP